MSDNQGAGMAEGVDRRIDEYLVICARLGDRAAFGRLAARWQKKLLVHAWRLTGDEQMAQDAVQEGWLEIVRGIGRLQDGAAFPAWAYRIVTRRCARLIGRIRRGRRLDAAFAAEPRFERDEDGAPSGPDIDLVRRALRRLPPGQQAAVALFYLEEMSVGEVAAALDVPLGTVKTRLMHAREKLREAIMGGQS
jgi:RNA polymerase sigma-70 factor (ECF subfamily)